MEYNEYLPHYYNNNQSFLQKRLDPSVIRDTKIFEKTQIKWFDINELAKRRNEFRSFYRNIIDLILENKTELEKFARQSKNGRKNKTRKNRI
jgi:protein associated with RNAse G/E